MGKKSPASKRSVGGGMNCPSAARLTFLLTYNSVYAIFEIKR